MSLTNTENPLLSSLYDLFTEKFGFPFTISQSHSLQDENANEKSNENMKNLFFILGIVRSIDDICCIYQKVTNFLRTIPYNGRTGIIKYAANVYEFRRE